MLSARARARARRRPARRRPRRPSGFPVELGRRRRRRRLSSFVVGRHEVVPRHVARLARGLRREDPVVARRALGRVYHDAVARVERHLRRRLRREGAPRDDDVEAAAGVRRARRRRVGLDLAAGEPVELGRRVPRRRRGRVRRRGRLGCGLLGRLGLGLRSGLLCRLRGRLG